MTTTAVWERNIGIIRGIIYKVKNGFGLEDNFFYEAQNIFFANFDEYYEEDGQYLSFFRICIKNKAKNIYRENKLKQRHISTIEIDNEQVSIFDFIEQRTMPSVESELLVKEIEQFVNTNFDEVGVFVFEHLAEGWSCTDIAEMLSCRVADVYSVRKQLRAGLENIL